MIFFIAAASIMAACILGIHKLTKHFDVELPLSSLLLCGVFALVINFSVVTLTPFLNNTYYYTLGALVLLAALSTTCFNKYLLHRHASLLGVAGHGQVELTAEADAADTVPPELDFASFEGTTDTPVEDDALDEQAAETATEPAAEPMPTVADIETPEEKMVPDPLPDDLEQLKKPAPIAAIVDEMFNHDAETIEPSETEEPVEPIAEVAESETASEPVEAAADAVAVETETKTTDEPVEIVDTDAEATAETNEKVSLEATAEASPSEETILEVTGDTAPIEEVISMADAEAQTTVEVQPPEEIPLDKEAEPEPAPSEEAVSEPEAETTTESSSETPEVVSEPTSPEEVTAEQAEEEAVDAPAEKPAEQIADDFAAIPAELADTFAAMDTMDQLLDYAFEQDAAHHKDAALWAYHTALERYSDDDYAPFVVIAITNIYKEQGQYTLAIKSFAEALDLPALAGNAPMRQQFEDSLAYLTAAKAVLEEAHLEHLPWREIPKDKMLQIESIYKSRKSR